jgi:hypothetical protein
MEGFTILFALFFLGAVLAILVLDIFILKELIGVGAFRIRHRSHIALAMIILCTLAGFAYASGVCRFVFPLLLYGAPLARAILFSKIDTKNNFYRTMVILACFPCAFILALSAILSFAPDLYFRTVSSMF